MIYGTRITTICIAILLSLSFTVSAEQVPELTQFNNGERADAEVVNSNFSKLKETVDKNDLKEGGVVNGPLTVPSITYSAPKSASVTYSAMGFVPEDNTVRFLKNIDNGSLSISNQEDEGQFFHCLTLRPGVTITRIRAETDVVTAGLYQQGISEPLANSNHSEDLSITIEPSSSYFIAVKLNNPNLIFNSVTIDYTYTEP